MANTSIYKIYGQAAGGSVPIDIRAAGTIVGVLLDVTCICSGGAAAVGIELSWINQETIQQNDISNSLATLIGVGGAANAAIDESIYVPMSVSVAAGERIFLNSKEISGTAAMFFMVCHLIIEDQAVRATRTRR